MIRWITCREFVAFLDDYLAGVLPDDRVLEFNNHLSGCPPCVAYLQTYEQAIRLGREALQRTDDPLPEDVPEGLVQAILGRRPQA